MGTNKVTYIIIARLTDDEVIEKNGVVVLMLTKSSD